MSLSRIYCPGSLILDSEMTLPKEASHHLGKVLRIKTGEKIIVFNGIGDELMAEVVSLSRQGIIIDLQEQIKRPSPESSLKVHLGQAISRNDRMDYAIQKAVELGVFEITPLITEYCQIKFDPKRMDNRLQHWQKIIIAACEQCGRIKIPVLNPAKPLQTWLNEKNDMGIVCSISPTTHLFEKFDFNVQDTSITVNLLVGPEGGLTKDELFQAQETHKYLTLSLGPRILRTETATVAALTLLQHHWGDL